jgi:toxin CcdB
VARFDLYRNPARSESKDIPLLLDVQSDFLETLETRMIVPLRRADRFGKTIEHLNPVIVHEQQRLVLDTASMASVPRAELKQPTGNIRAMRLEVENALDFLFTGI